MSELLSATIPDWQVPVRWVAATLPNLVEEGRQRAKEPSQYDFEVVAEERVRYGRAVICLTASGDMDFLTLELSSVAWAERVGETIPADSLADKAQTQGGSLVILYSGYKVVEQGEFHWKLAWLIAVRNVSAHDIVLRSATVNFLDQNGFVLEKALQFVDRLLKAGETTTLRNFAIVPPETARRVEAAEVLVEGM